MNILNINISDEAHIHVDSFVNRQNRRIWGHMIVKKLMYPQCVHCLMHILAFDHTIRS